MSNVPITSLIGAGFPVLLLWLKLTAVFTRMAKRKGVATKLVFIGAFPVWAILFGLWLMSRTNEIHAATDNEPSGTPPELQ